MPVEPIFVDVQAQKERMKKVEKNVLFLYSAYEVYFPNVSATVLSPPQWYLDNFENIGLSPSWQV